MEHVEVYSNDYIKEMRKNRESQEKIAAWNIAAQNRVDISLKKYEEMMSEIAELKRNNEALKEREGAIGLLLSKLDIPFEQLSIDTESVYTDTSVDMISGKTKYLIVFTADRVGR